MSFLALCPYCRIGRVPAADDAFGRTARCPHCRADFTLAPPDEPPHEPLTWRELPAAPPAVVAKPRRKDVARPRPTEEVDTVVVPAAPTAAAPKVAKPYTDWDAEQADPPPAIPRATVVALFLIALGLIASQVPYGRTGTVATAVLGLLFGLIGWVAVGGLRLPAVATGLNAVLLLVVVAVPSWLGLESWWPPKIGEDPKQIRVFDLNGLGIPDGEWISADRSWQFDDVRVQVTGVSAGPVELTGPDGKKRWSKGKYLIVTVKVANVGVARQLAFPKWDLTPTKSGDPVPTLVDASAVHVSRAEFEAGWRAILKDPSANLLPTQAGERTFLFQLPAAPTNYLRLELPATEFGSPQPVRFQLNAAQIPAAGKKNP